MKKTDRAAAFRRLHHTGNMLLLPNIWDPITAALVEYCGFTAVATSGIAIARAHGLQEEGRVPFQLVLRVLKRMVDSVDIPVSVDIGPGFSEEPGRLQEQIFLMLDAGIAGIGIHDSHPFEPRLYSIDEQCARIALVRETIERAGRSLFVNARVDTPLHGRPPADDTALQEIVIRSRAYLEAGADGIFPIFIRQRDHVQALLEDISAPLNLIAIHGIPSLDVLNDMGVARFSLGPGEIKYQHNQNGEK